MAQQKKVTKPKHHPTKRGKKVAWKLENADWDRIKGVLPNAASTSLCRIATSPCIKVLSISLVFVLPYQ